MALKPSDNSREMENAGLQRTPGSDLGRGQPGTRGRTDEVMGAAWNHGAGGLTAPGDALRQGRYYEAASRRMSDLRSGMGVGRMGSGADRWNQDRDLGRGDSSGRPHEGRDMHFDRYGAQGGYRGEMGRDEGMGRDWNDSSRWGRDERGMEDRSQTFIAGERGHRYGDRGEIGRRMEGMRESWSGRMQEGRRGRWQREPLTAREIMTRNVKTVRPESPLRDAAQIMKDENVGIVPVVNEQGRLVGLLTDRDIVVRAFVENRTPDQFRVQDVMSDELEAVTGDEDVHALIELMGKKQVRRVPVVDRDDRLVGIVALADIATRADFDEELQDALERISSKRSFWSRLFS